MNQNGILTNFTLRLRMIGPVHVGSGRTIGKKEYCLDPQSGKATVYNAERFLALIVKYNLMNAYEAYLLNDVSKGLYDFFLENRNCQQYFKKAADYVLPVGDAIAVDGPPVEIRCFMRTAKGEPYIPGSSVKGMLRTALTTAALLGKEPEARKPSFSALSDKKSAKKESNAAMRRLNTELFHTLKCDEKLSGNAVNSVFRGLIVSDSAPLSTRDLILCRKIDVTPDGGQNRLNVIRECLRPGLTVDIPVTIDQSLAGGLTPEKLEQAIRNYSAWYDDTVLSFYPDVRFPSSAQYLLLGGGSGYQSKTVTYQWLGREKGLAFAQKILTLQFPKKKNIVNAAGDTIQAAPNETDAEDYGISPHMLKTASVDGSLLPYGMCEVEII